jgi:EAL domain-containing protein (putative c-di-GMP-specific phosphodiesterase class I)
LHPDRFPGVQDSPTCGVGLMLVDPRTDSPSDVLNTVYRDFLFGALESAQTHSTAGISGPPASSATSESSDENRRYVSLISEALEGDSFHLVYQPIVSLKGDSQENYNVLLRLTDAEGKVLNAEDFLPAAIQSGRMVAIDRWVLRTAITRIANMRSDWHKLNFFINISEDTLQEEKLLIWICDYMRDHQVRGNWLTFQILEEHARRHSASFTRLSEGLKRVKCRVALNRFGLGTEPQLALKGLQADFVKFAPELCARLADDQPKQRKLLELARLAREAGIRSVVTGVEDARSLTVLWTAGIDYVQGNFLQKPTDTIETPEQYG